MFEQNTRVIKQDISDRSLIYVYRKLSPAFRLKGHSTISYRNFKNFNWGSYRNDIAQQDKTCNGSDDPNVLWADWKTKFLDVVYLHAPLRTKHARIKKSTLDQFRIKERHARSWCCQKKGMASNDARAWAKYKKLRNTRNNNIKTSKASYYSNAFSQSKGNSRKTWQTIKELTSRRTNDTTVKELKLNGPIISNSSELSIAFNGHFSPMGPRLANEIPPNDNNNDLSYINNINIIHNKFSFSSTSSSIVFSHLNKLYRSKAKGLDNISAKIVRECADLISVSLCDLCNKSLLSGIFPDDWKCARVTPLFKQGETSDLIIDLFQSFPLLLKFSKGLFMTSCIIFWAMKSSIGRTG